jgi:hypothetical protein
MSGRRRKQSAHTIETNLRYFCIEPKFGGCEIAVTADHHLEQYDTVSFACDTIRVAGEAIGATVAFENQGTMLRVLPQRTCHPTCRQTVRSLVSVLSSVASVRRRQKRFVSQATRRARIKEAAAAATATPLAATTDAETLLTINSEFAFLSAVDLEKICHRKGRRTGTRYSEKVFNYDGSARPQHGLKFPEK